MPINHHTDRGPMGLSQYNSLEEYCDPHTASSVFLIVISIGVCLLDYLYNSVAIKLYHLNCILQ